MAAVLKRCCLRRDASLRLHARQLHGLAVARGIVALDVCQGARTIPTKRTSSKPVQTFMALNADHIAPGWCKAAIRTLVKLLAVADGSPMRRRAIAGLRVCSTSTELCFSTLITVENPDAVFLGICRKARQRSCTICRDCGRSARIRLIGEDQSITQCARCVAPALLKHEIWELDQALRFLKAVGQPISASQIPPLLRPSFLEASAREPVRTDGKGRQDQMAVYAFANWAEGWRQIGQGLAVVH